MIEKTADLCVAALLVLAAIVWAFGIGADAGSAEAAAEIGLTSPNK